MTLLAVDSLSKTFGSNSRRGSPSGVEAVADLTFEVEAGEFLSIIGPSGCGKSTLLRLLAGLVQPDRGRIILLWAAPAGRVRSAGAFWIHAPTRYLVAMAHGAR